MRFLLFSDLQAHNWKEFSTTNDLGINSRFQDHLVVLDQIYSYAITNNIKHIYFGGDLFEARGRVDVVVAKMLAEWKWKVSKAGIHQIDIMGNHDEYDKSSIHNVIDLYKNIPGQIVVTHPQFVNDVYCVPYMHSVDEVKKALQGVKAIKPSAAIIHYGLYDVPLESQCVIKDLGYDTEGQIRLTDLEPITSQNLFKFVFFGHYHVTHPITNRVHFIGTPLQHKWAERTVETRFLDVDLDADKFTAIHTNAPKFVHFENIEDIDPGKIQGNFCRVMISDQEEKDRCVKIFTDAGAGGISTPLKPKVKSSENRLGLNLGMSFDEMAIRLVDNDKETKLDKDKLKSLIVELFKQAQEKKG